MIVSDDIMAAVHNTNVMWDNAYRDELYRDYSFIIGPAVEVERLCSHAKNILTNGRG